MGEFMTAVHHRLPVKVIVYNNSALGLITLEAESVGLVPFREAIEFPNPDFAALARACGGHGFSARPPGPLKNPLCETPPLDRPALLVPPIRPPQEAHIPPFQPQPGRPFPPAQNKEN